MAGSIFGKSFGNPINKESLQTDKERIRDLLQDATAETPYPERAAPLHKNTIVIWEKKKKNRIRGA
jgi:hypothetical protein